MARTSTKNTQAPTTEVLPQVVTAPTVITEAVVDEQPKAKKQKKTAQPKVEVSTPEPVVVTTEVLEEPIVDTIVDDAAGTTVTPVVTSPAIELLTSALAKNEDLINKINTHIIGLTVLKAELKNNTKDLAKTLKLTQKELSKGKRRKGSKNSSPQGFNKPTYISDELAKFINVEPGAIIARNIANKGVHNYIKSNQLNKGKVIHPDAALAKILNYTEGVDQKVLTYLNLQTYLKPHFIGNNPVSNNIVADITA